MQWSAQQQAALDKVFRWIDDPGAPQIFRFFGFAGTGKTTLARVIHERLGGRAIPCAYTGKAASVLAKKGLTGARTVHSLIYNPSGTDNAKHIEELKTELQLLKNVKEPARGTILRINAVERALKEAEEKGNRPSFVLKEASDVTSAPLVILDEASMCDGRLAEDLLSFGVKVMAMGDPAQLPPVRGTGYFTENAKPDVLLTDVRRNAGPILRLATAIREGRSYQLGSWATEESSLTITTKVDAEQALAANQILCGTNRLRQSCNRRHRKLLGHSESIMPLAGERLMCLKNDRELGLLNGTQWITEEDAIWEGGSGQVFLRVSPEEGGAALGFPAQADLFTDDDTKTGGWGNGQQFTFGYATTVHKFQGSEADNVMLFRDWSRPETLKQWLYTGATRAAKHLTLVEL